MTAARPPHTADLNAIVLIGVLLLLASEWLLVLSELVGPDAFDLGFTRHNVVYVVVRTGLVATAALVAGAAALGRRGLLIAASVVAGLHLLFALGMAVVQFVLGARIEFLLETGALLFALLLIAAGVVLGWLASARNSSTLRWAAVAAAATGILVRTVSEFPMVLAGIGLAPVALLVLLVNLIGGVLLVLAVAFLALPSRSLRFTAAVFILLVLVVLMLRLPDAIGEGTPYGPLFIVLRVLLIAAAGVMAFLAARSTEPRGSAQPSSVSTASS